MTTDRENLLNTLLLAIAVGLILFAGLLLAAPLSSLLFMGALLAIAIFVAEAFLWKFPLGVVHAPPDRTIAYFSRELRIAGYPVAETPTGLTVRIGSGAIVKLRVKAIGGDSKLTYQADATLVGWSSIAALFTVLSRVRSWVRERLRPLVPGNGTLPDAPCPDDVRAILLDALAEAHHLASEACEAERDIYQSSQAMIGVGAIMGWFVLFAGLSFESSEPDFSARMTSSAILATLFSLAVALPGAWWIRRRRRGRLLQAQEWVNRLHHALAREAAGSRPEAEETSSFELLAEASQEVPRWLEAVRRAGMSQDPAAWVLLSVMVWFGVLAVFSYAPSLGVFSLPLGVSIGFGGMGILVGAYAYYRGWKRRRDETLVRQRAEWNRRFERVRRQMEEYLEGL